MVHAFAAEFESEAGCWLKTVR